MNKIILTAAAASIFALAPLTQAGAQMSSMLNNTMNSTGSGMSMPGMGSMGMSLPSVSSASPTNLAGLLQYCVQNNYLSGGSADAASSAKESLLSKFTGSSSDPTSNTGFTSGNNGVLDTGNGQSTTLGGSGIKAQITQKVCSEVLSHAKSML